MEPNQGANTHNGLHVVDLVRFVSLVGDRDLTCAIAEQKYRNIDLASNKEITEELNLLKCNWSGL